MYPYAAGGYGAGYGYPPAVSYPGTYPAAGYGAYPAYPAAGYGAPAVAAPMPVVLGPNYIFQFAGCRLDRPIKDIIFKASGKPSPFLAIYCTTNPYQPLTFYQQKAESIETGYRQTFGAIDPDWVMIHKSETVHGCQNPTWAPVTFSLQQLCAGNWDAPIKFEVWDHHDSIGHDFIGGALTTLRELQAQREVRLVNRRRIGIFNTSGLIQMLQFNQI